MIGSGTSVPRWGFKPGSSLKSVARRHKLCPDMSKLRSRLRHIVFLRRCTNEAGLPCRFAPTSMTCSLIWQRRWPSLRYHASMPGRTWPKSAINHRRREIRLREIRHSDNTYLDHAHDPPEVDRLGARIPGNNNSGREAARAQIALRPIMQITIRPFVRQRKTRGQNDHYYRRNNSKYFRTGGHVASPLKPDHCDNINSTMRTRRPHHDKSALHSRPLRSLFLRCRNSDVDRRH